MAGGHAGGRVPKVRRAAVRRLRALLEEHVRRAAADPGDARRDLPGSCKNNTTKEMLKVEERCFLKPSFLSVKHLAVLITLN